MGEINRSGKYIKFFIYLIVIVLINIAGMTLFTRVDLTNSKIYSISDASKEVVATLSEPLTINIFFTKNLPAPYNNTEQYLHDLLEEYAIHAGKYHNYFNYRFYNISSEGEGVGENVEGNRTLARNYGISPVQIRHFEKDEIKFKNAFMGLVIIHGDIIEKIPTITSTEGLEYKLTTSIQKLNNKISALLALKQKIQITLYLSSSMKQVAPFMGLKSLPQLPEKVEKAVEKLNSKNYGKIEFTYLDPSEDPKIEAEAAEQSLMALKWPAIPQKNIDPGSGIIGLTMRYEKKIVDVPLLSIIQFPLIGTRYELIDMESLEEVLNENIETLIDINENIGFLSDHGALSLFGSPPVNPMMGSQDDGLSNFNSLVSRNYSFKNISLADEKIPESLKCMIIAGPTEPFTDYELYQIDQYLMRGKSLAIIMDRFKEVMPQRRQTFSFNQGSAYVPIDTGLEKLLNHYGVRAKKSYVMDENCYKQTNAPQFGGGETPIYFAPIIQQENINPKPTFMKNIKGLITLKISPLELLEDRIKAGNIKATNLFSSSDKSWEMKGRISLNPRFIRPPKSDDEKESMPLSFLLEGEFQSYFDGKPIPVKKTESDDADEDEKDIETIGPKTPEEEKPEIDLSKVEGQGGFIAKSKPAKIFMLASSDMLKNNILDSEGKGPNTTFILNVIDYLNNREDTALMRSKEQTLNPLFETDALTKTAVKYFNIAGLPVLVSLFGFFVWLKRRSRKKQIRMIFQKS
ncbi:MAG: Gldg family protein [Deltaproteobacteria bacterium]|nr:Gldg family protein [Deltaproteobacteria bacterium]